jgi:hypothetical protein
MISDYLNSLLDKFDAEFNAMFNGGQTAAEEFFCDSAADRVLQADTIPARSAFAEMPASSPRASFAAEIMPFPRQDDAVSNGESGTQLKLDKIYSLAVKISVERYSPNYNPEIALANLLNLILRDEDGKETDSDNFFELLNKEHSVELPEALTEFDFYNNNPYRTKAEKILSKIEARKNKGC